jgi:uncharacterized membrane protein YiaA|tara:strand:- start:293 stop:514 length:222 start_codon:yes stop_codon:yes gene_type:complete
LAKTKDKQPELTLDDKGYFFDEMSEKQKGIYLHLKNVNDKIQSNGFLGEQLEVTKGALIQMFRETLSEEKEEK